MTLKRNKLCVVYCVNCKIVHTHARTNTAPTTRDRADALFFDNMRGV